ncbi:MAG TPA: hypothetical protein VFY01_01015, partial [Rheinheimera sp.]|nr:hypothetical protein [Rheinheimera sp.]
MQKQEAEPSAQQAAEPGTANTAAADSSVAQQTVDKLTELAALGWSVSEHYTEQIRLSGQTAKAELRLSGRSLTLAAGLIVCLGAGLVLLWCSLL